MHKSRALSRETGAFVRVTPGSQSLERGIRLLRAFLEGAPSLSNSELAARTRLPKATVSRLTRSLVDGGMLDFDPLEESYRLAPSCLSFARAFHFGRSEMLAVDGLLKRFAREHEVNIGLSSPDLIHMVYMSTFREARGTHTRTIAPGGRLLMPASSPGIAYIASAGEGERRRLYGLFESHYGGDWPKVQEALEKDLHAVQVRGFSQAASSFGTLGVAAMAFRANGAGYAINASFNASEPLKPGLTLEILAAQLLVLVEDVQAAWKTSAG